MKIVIETDSEFVAADIHELTEYLISVDFTGTVTVDEKTPIVISSGKRYARQNI